MSKQKSGARGWALQEYMNRKGIKTRAQLAKHLGISAGMVTHYFKGARIFGAKTALRISDLTEIPMEELYR